MILEPLWYFIPLGFLTLLVVLQQFAMDKTLRRYRAELNRHERYIATLTRALSELTNTKIQDVEDRIHALQSKQRIRSVQ